jgi:PAS domain S-box-containing protein
MAIFEESSRNQSHPPGFIVESLDNSADEFRLMFEHSPHGVVFHDAKGAIISANGMAEKIFGLTLDQMQGRTPLNSLWKCIHEDGSPFPGDTYPAMVALNTGAQVDDVIMGVFNPSLNQLRWLKVSAVPLIVPGTCRPYKVFASFVDITDFRQVENSLRESSDRFRAYIDQAADALFIHDFSGHFVDVNIQACVSLGYSREELLEMNITDLEVDFDLPKAQAAWQCILPHQPFTLVGHHRRKNGAIFPVEVRFGSFIQGTERLFMGAVRDITDRQKAEDTLLESEAFNISVLNSLPEHIVVINQQGVILAVNHAWRQFAINNGAAELSENSVGMNYLGVTAVAHQYPEGDNAEQLDAEIRAVLAGERATFSFEYPCHSPTEQRWFLMHVTPLKGSQGGAVISHENITSRKLIEQKLRDLGSHLESVRESEKSRIAREIHDELGSSINALKMTSRQLLSELQNLVTAPKLLSKAQDMSALIDNAMATIRRIISDLHPTVLEDLGLLAAIEWQVSQFQKMTGITCVVNCIADEGGLNRDYSLALFRILQESLTNVARHSGARQVEVEFHHGEDEVLLSISDDGTGVADVQQTTSHGYGLIGMAERATQLGGSLRQDSASGKGFTLTVVLPLPYVKRVSE